MTDLTEESIAQVLAEINALHGEGVIAMRPTKMFIFRHPGETIEQYGARCRRAQAFVDRMTNKQGEN